MKYKYLILLLFSSFSAFAQTAEQCLSNAKPITPNDQHLECFKIGKNRAVQYTYDKSGQIISRKFIGSFKTITEKTPQTFMSGDFHTGVLKELYSDVRSLPSITQLFTAYYLSNDGDFKIPTFSEFDAYWTKQQKEINNQVIAKWNTLNRTDKALIWTSWDFFRLYYREMFADNKTATAKSTITLTWFAKTDLTTGKFIINDPSMMLDQINQSLYKTSLDRTKADKRYQKNETTAALVQDVLNSKRKSSIQQCNPTIYNELTTALKKPFFTLETNSGGLFMYDLYNIQVGRWVVSPKDPSELESMHELFDVLHVDPILQDFITSYLITKINGPEFNFYRKHIHLYLADLFVSSPRANNLPPEIKTAIQQKILKPYQNIVFNAALQGAVDQIPCVL